GESIFAKEWPSGPPPEGFFHAEACGLRWLGSAGAVPVPEVLVETPDLLGMAWVEHGSPTREAAARFGSSLAELHRAGADSFGAPWAGYHGSQTMDNTPSQKPWHAWYSEYRLMPYLKASLDRGALGSAEAQRV